MSNDDKQVHALQLKIRNTLKKNNGILFAKPSLVGRHTYKGRDILAPNSDIALHGDERGYVPVEWWISSTVSAGNPILKDNEGVASYYLSTDAEPTLLTDILRASEEEIFGDFGHAWPLIKVLDIGGRAVQPGFTESKSSANPALEVPPIPAHVHNGYICRGCACGHGKLEAYFFPPLPKDTAPFEAKTRLGVIPNTSKDTLVRCMNCFGMNDSMYEHLNEYTVVPFSGWTIECGVIHAPGPYPTFEVQLPQDDGNLLAWQLGQTIENEQERREEQVRSMLRSETIDTGQLFDEVVDLKLTSDPMFREKYFHPSQKIDSGDWGERLQTFFQRFYGEAIRLNPNSSYVLPASEQPCALVVWSGRGTVNGHAVQVEDTSVGLEQMKQREMLIVPHTMVEITNIDEQEPLLLLSVYPFKPASNGARSGVAVAGLSCVDYVIQNCGELTSPTDHVTAENYVKRCGGSVYNTGKCIRFMSSMHQHLCRVEALSLVGEDDDGDFIMSQLKLCGIGTKYVSRSKVANTQVAFLPNYSSGERACIVVPGTSSLLHRDHLFGEVGLGCQRKDMLREMLWMNLGYPYELPQMQGENLSFALSELRSKSVNVAVAIDLNGAAAVSKFDDTTRWPVIASSLQHVCAVHMNWEEALALCASAHCVTGREGDLDWMTELHQQRGGERSMGQLNKLANYFFECGVAIVTITLGSQGAFIAVHSDSQHVMRQFGAAAPEAKYVEQWCATSAVMSEIPKSSAPVLDTVGAGDSFLAGLLMALESMAVIKENCKDLLSEENKTLLGLLNWSQTCAGQMISGV